MRFIATTAFHLEPERYNSMSKQQSRRTWLANSLSGVMTASFGLSGGFAEEKKAALDIIDCHTHFYDPTRPQGVPWPKKGSFLYRTVLPKHLKQLKQYRKVTGTVIVEASRWVEDNAWLLELARNEPFIVGIVGNLTPGAEDFSKHLKRFAANPLFRGIRVSAQKVEELVKANSLQDFKLLVDHDLELDINGGPNSPAVASLLAAKLPKLRIVINHIGNVHVTANSPPKVWSMAIQSAAKHPLVYCKLSALVEGAARNGKKASHQLSFYKPYIDVVWNAFGDDRVIYGSNWPVSDRAADYYTLQRIVMEYVVEKGDKVTRKFCSLNAKKAYQWIERKGRL